MTEIKLLTLEMENFKGCAHRRVNFNGEDLALYGANGCGKSTHYDAVCWVLFGKDSKGNVPGERSDFQIKPKNSLGSGLMPTVTLTITVNGEPVTLRKIYREKWETPRGCPEARFSGNTTECYIDDVPKKESEYKAYIAAIIDEKTWRLLTDVYLFCRDMPWRDRRALLFDLCKVRSDAEILADKPEFAPLADELGRRTVDDLKTKAAADRRKINKQLDTLPVRIDECSKTVADISGMDFSVLRADLDSKRTAYDKVQKQLSRLVNNTALQTAVLNRTEATNKRAALVNENNAHRQSQNVPVHDPRPGYQAEIDRLERERAELVRAVETAKKNIADGDKSLKEKRDKWYEIDGEQFPEDVCPYCGQTMPTDEHVARAKAVFEENKTRRKEQLVKESDAVKKAQERQRSDIACSEKAIIDLDNKLKKQKLLLAACAAPAPVVIEDLPGYAEQLAALDAEIAAADAEIHRLRADDRAVEAELRAESSRIAADLDGIRAKLAKEQVLEDAKTRIKQYEDERRAAGQELARLDNLLYLIEEFSRYKAEAITDSINALFDKIRFRLFVNQVNGGLADCCEVLYDGKVYGSCSSGEHVKAALDAIKGLSRAYDLRVPLILDGAESVTDLPETGTQTIRLVVSENDKELRYA